VNERYICIHGHFYQPPRENPWLEAIELQDSAYPYHDWNERIASECYAPNATARILDQQGRIMDIVNNYARISFNFGPTLLAWLEQKAPEVYRSILQADRESQERFSGHGSALAQAYNHMILPLANHRDKYTQMVWGIRDFERRFGRAPEGMWLPETAVDLESLDILAELGIQFTILAPRQASKVRPIGSNDWQDVNGERIDPTMAYSLRLPSGGAITLFFYDGPISRAVAFEGTLSNGETLAHRLLGGFSEGRTWAQLVHIATDGESYGHHYPNGDMALAYALHHLEANNLARLTNYGEYLERHPPTHEVQIFENSSWSCIHGVERWRSDCGCNSGRHPAWNQAWRAPLRKALDWLRDTLAPMFARKGRLYLKDPWKARNDYIQIILDRSEQSLEGFLEQHAVRVLDEQERTTVLKLLELQRHAMLMYTSCGWFFDELSGLEAVQVIQYAGRAFQLAQDTFGKNAASLFPELLEEAKGNISEHRNGRFLYEKFVLPAALDLQRVGAHYAVSSLFEEYGEAARIFCYKAGRQDYQIAEAGKAKLAVGRMRLTSEITHEAIPLDLSVLHFGDHNLKAGVRESQSEERYRALVEALTSSFKRGDFTETANVVGEYFGESTYSLRSLFRDEQRRILEIIQQANLANVEAVFRQIYENNVPFLHFLKDIGNPPPKVLATVAEFVLNVTLRRKMEKEELNLEPMENLLETARLMDVSLDAASLEMAIRRRLEGMAARLALDPAQLPLVGELETAVALARTLPFPVDVRQVQNVCHEVLQSTFPGVEEEARAGDKSALAWVDRFSSLCDKLELRVDET
jgi:alpha-amylase/alpha-mannosidase (GH57 family)